MEDQSLRFSERAASKLTGLKQQLVLLMSRLRDVGSCPCSSRLSHIVNPGTAGSHSVVFGHLCPDRPRAFLIFIQPLVIRLVIKWNQASQIVSEVVFRLWSAYFSHPLVIMRRATAPREGGKNKPLCAHYREAFHISWWQKRVNALLVTPCIRQQIATSRRLAGELRRSYHLQQSKSTHTWTLADQSRKYKPKWKKSLIGRLVTLYFI